MISNLSMRRCLSKLCLIDMDIVLASRNQKKIRELKELISSVAADISILSLDDIGYYDDTEENGNSFEENSLIKATVPAKMGYIGVADDSGLCVDVLNGAPGIYSARFSGDDATDEKNNAKLLNDLKDFSNEERSAHFMCAVSCVFPKNMGEITFPRINGFKNLTGVYPAVSNDLPVFAVTGSVGGIILNNARGSNGFGYDPLFYIPQKGKTFAELTNDEKNEISHRGLAMRQFATVFGEILKGL